MLLKIISQFYILKGYIRTNILIFQRLGDIYGTFLKIDIRLEKRGWQKIYFMWIFLSPKGFSQNLFSRSSIKRKNKF